MKMGSKYMANCSNYPYGQEPPVQIQSQWLVVFVVKFILATRKYQIIDVVYRDFV